jgi:hypothetical protein
MNTRQPGSVYSPYRFGKHALSSSMVDCRRVSKHMSAASFFDVPQSRRECASTAAPVHAVSLVHRSSNALSCLLTWQIRICHNKLFELSANLQCLRLGKSTIPCSTYPRQSPFCLTSTLLGGFLRYPRILCLCSYHRRRPREVLGLFSPLRSALGCGDESGARFCHDMVQDFNLSTRCVL